MERRSIMFRMASIWLLAGLLLAVPTTASTETIELSTRPVQLVFDNREADRLGSLRYLGGLALTSPAAEFGGISGLVVTGDELTAVTDRGYWFRARVTIDGNQRLADLVDARLAPILSSRGEPLSIPRWEHDAEALTVWNGIFAVSFERFHRIALYEPDGGDEARPVYLSDIPRLAEQPSNGGIEALAGLGDGRLVALSEEMAADEGWLAGWLIDGERREVLRYPSTRWKPTDAAFHPDVGLLVLERRFSGLGGFSGRVRQIDPATIHPGARLAGSIVARFEAPTITDNFEGLSISEDENGQLTIWLASDDNFSFLQRTLLLAFRWEPR